MALAAAFECQTEFSYDDIRTAHCFSLVSAFLSLWGSALMITAHFGLGSSSSLRTLVAGLALADYVVAIVNMIKGSMIIFAPDAFGPDLCVSIRVIWQTAAGASIGYTCAIGVYVIYCLMRRTIVAPAPLVVALHVLSWGVPLALVLPMVPARLIHQSPNTLLCYPLQIYHIVFWFVPVVLGIFFTFLLVVGIVLRLVVVSRQLHASGFSQIQLRSLAGRFSLYLIVLIVAWSFDVINYVTLQFNGDCNLLFMVILYSCLVDSLGFMDAVVYGVTNSQYRDRVYAMIRRPLGFFVVAASVVVAPLLAPVVVAWVSLARLLSWCSRVRLPDDSVTVVDLDRIPSEMSHTVYGETTRLSDSAYR